MPEYPNLEEFINALNAKSDGSLSLEKLLERAYDIRKFEIELNWKRGTYFWGFLIASFTAYFIVSDISKFEQTSIIKLIVICIGYIFSLSWYYVNRGSLYWQYNYERIIEAIEESLKINFYKSNLVNTTPRSDIFSAHPFALGRINIMVSLFVCLIWVVLLFLYFFYPENALHFNRPLDFGKVSIILITIIFSVTIFYKGKFQANKKQTFSFRPRDISYK